MNFSKKNVSQVILTILFIFYLITDKKLPVPIANLVDTPFGKIMVIVISLSLFAFANPLLAILGIVVAYFVIQNASMQTGTYGLEEYAQTESKKWSSYEPRYQHNYTLEEEIVKERASTRFNTSFIKTPWKPVLDDIHDASPANV
jgi:hypothetical protein